MSRKAPLDPPWWRARLENMRPLVGQVLAIEQICDLLPDYPNGCRPKPMTTARRLRGLGAIEVVSRGPNNRLGRGATYRVVSSIPPVEQFHNELVDIDYLEQLAEHSSAKFAERQTKAKKRREKREREAR